MDGASTRPTTASKSARWRLRNWRLRTKVLAVLMIPTVAALFLGALRVRTDLGDATALAKLNKQVELEGTVADVVQQLQRERDLTVRFVAANHTGDQTVLDRQRKRVNDSVDGLQSKVTDLSGQIAPDAADSYRRTTDQLTRLSSLRQAVQSTQYPADAALRAYTDSIQSLLDLADQAIPSISQPDLARLQLATNGIARAKEQDSRRRALLLEVFQTGQITPNQQRDLLAADAQLAAAVNDFRKEATPAQQRIYDDTVTGLIVDQANNMEEAALARTSQREPVTGPDLNPDRWDIAATLTVNLTDQVERSLLDQLQGQTSDLATQSRNKAIIESGGVLGALLLAVLMALFVARSLLRPLRVLRRTALDVADRRLPEAVQRIMAEPNPQEAANSGVDPVPIDTKEEVGQVARAFDAVHGQAVRLAAEQALLRDNVNSIFVNLSRRSQTLVERQLALIDRLEQDEQDPDQLASLFELDHLATRMRRNSENLLVLSGTDLSRRLTKPVPVSDVIGAAVSEVEQYARVQVLPSPELSVQGRAVNDLMHLIAELLDNATAYSDPATKVTVRSARTRRGELAIEIQDRGVGMLEQEIAEANERLANPPEVDVSVSRRMGLYVVARLAKRHDVRVRLRANEDIEGGTTALVLVPESLVHVPGEGPAPSPLPSMPPPPAGSFPSTTFPPLPSENTGENATTRAATQASGIASAFTGSMPRVRSDDTGLSVPPITSHNGEATVTNARPFGADGDGAFSGVGAAEPARIGDTAHDVTTSLFTSFDEADPGAADLEPATSVFPPAGPPETAQHNGAWGASSKEVERELDAPTERLPIYEAVLSQWFQAVEAETPADEVRPIPSGRGYDFADTAAPARAETPHDQPEPAAAVVEPEAIAPAIVEPVVVEPEVAEPVVVESEVVEPVVAEPVVAEQPADEHRPRHQAAEEAVPTAQAGSNGEQEGAHRRSEAASETSAEVRAAAWQSPADEGWERAQALLTPVSRGVTSAGLPKRVPNAQLVPGSAAARPQPQQPAPQPAATPRAQLPKRSPDAVRGRMASFQQGVQRGRHALIEAYADSSPSQGHRDEEQE
jgi:signal transduction histidine kinase